MKKLVIVESPTKARTIRSYLGDEFEIEASMGHVRDLPSSAREVPESLRKHKWASLGVNVDDDFEPLYVVPKDKQKVVTQLKKQLKKADELYIATDEDREGESIGWHLIQVLEPKVPVKRMVFHEITKDAIVSALDKTRDIDTNLVEAQETRRLLDRLVGYSISPVLWRVISKGLSAGRVQSVAVRLLVQREKERMAFVPASYWDLKAALRQNGTGFEAVMTHYRGIRLASGSDFDDDTGRLKAGLTPDKDVLLLSEEDARALAERLPSAPWRVANINERVSKRSPAPPFITSTLQQEASRKLSLSARETMRVAQRLYEHGHITYMRTDSTNLSRASGSDFDDDTGRLKAGLTPDKDVLLLSEEDARALAERLPSAPWRVANINERVSKRSPAPPFITSTLQQEASRKLSLSARETMRVAQRLYEHGHITYMRTDSTNLSREAVDGSRRAVEKRYGKEYLSDGLRQYGGKVRNAQEAHEAIRPAGGAMKTSRELGLSGIDARLYDLIWSRTIASQMADARIRLVTASIEARDEDNVAAFRASGRSIDFPGFFRAYVEGSDDPDAAIENQEAPLPKLQEGDTPDCDDVKALGHETRPPARYTEATLIRTLESEGIGRPSTYATIIDTVINRGYVRKVGTQLAPSFTAFAANNLLEAQFHKLVDVGFTAEMEQVLDDIAAGEEESTPYLRRFYDKGIESAIATVKEKVDPKEISTIHSPKWNGFVVRVGQYGPYLEVDVDGEQVRASLPQDLLPGEVTLEKLQEIAEAATAEDEVLGVHPEHNKPVFLKDGPYGPYVQLGEDDEKPRPKRQSLAPGLTKADVSFDVALDLLALPRVLGQHPDSGKDVKASIGRFGPYVQHEKTYASLKKGVDDVLKVELPRALELLAEKERKNKPLRVLGDHPETGDPIEVWAGRYGPYVKHQKTNASLPKGIEPDDVSMPMAIDLIIEQAKKGKKGRGTKKTAAKKSSAKKPAAKKATAKKAAPKKSAPKKSGSDE